MFNQIIVGILFIIFLSHGAVKCVCMCVINPPRACAARVTVVVLSVCLSVCVCVFRLFSDYRLRGGS